MPELQATVHDSQLAAMWEAFFDDYAREDVVRAALDWPEQRSVHVDFHDIQRKDPELADHLIQRPGHVLRVGNAMMHSVDVTVEPKPRLVLRVHHYPESMRILPRQLRAEHLGRHVVVQGIVMSMTKAWKRPIEAAFECRACGNIVYITQEEDSLLEPSICDACEKTGAIWRFKEDHTRWEDRQYVVIQESPDAIRGGSVPEAVHVELAQDLVHGVEVGDHVVFNGTLRAKRRRQGNRALVDFDNVLDANSVDALDETYADTEVPSAMEEMFQEIAARDDVHERLAQCFMPGIAGMEDAKTAIVYAMAGASTRRTAAGQRQRGEIHVLVAGDPGIAKSSLLENIDQFAPRVVAIEGSGASGAGIACAVDHDPIDKSWIVRAGALVQADGGICVFDELGLTDPEDRGHLNTAMESGYVLTTKVVKAKLRAETTVIAAMNPTIGERFDPFGTEPITQIGLPSALIGRFDLIFCFIDRVDAEKDARIADAVLAPPMEGDAKDVYDLVLSADEFRRYIAWVRNIDPVLSDEARQVLRDFYVQVRRGQPEHATATPRQITGLRRLTIASARLRASEVADASDAKRAIALVTRAFRSCGIMDADGKLDGDLLQFGVSRSQNERQRMLLQVIKDLCREHKDGYLRGWATTETIIERALDLGVEEEDARRGIKQLAERNTIYARGGADRWAPLAS